MPQYSDRQLQLLEEIRAEGRRRRQPPSERLQYEIAKARYRDRGGWLPHEGYDQLTLPSIGSLARHLID